MKTMRTAAAAPAEKHAKMAARVYMLDPVQRMRIRKAQDWFLRVWNQVEGDKICHVTNVTELCCGTGEITGMFSNGFLEVRGVDISPLATRMGEILHPSMHFTKADVETLTPWSGNILVLCESLEHLKDPEKLIRQWLPQFDAVIIGHPLNEPEDSDLSNGEHQFSFDRQDFENWFPMGGHSFVQCEEFDMEHLRMVIGYGVRKN